MERGLWELTSGMPNDKNDTWERIWRAFLASLDEVGKLDWSWAFLDGSFVPVKKVEVCIAIAFYTSALSSESFT